MTLALVTSFSRSCHQAASRPPDVAKSGDQAGLAASRAVLPWPESCRSRSGTAYRIGRSVGRLTLIFRSLLVTAPAVTVSGPSPPTSTDRGVDGSGSALSAT